MKIDNLAKSIKIKRMENWKMCLSLSHTHTPFPFPTPFTHFFYCKRIHLLFFLLQEREKSVLMMVIPLQVIENIASVVIEETGPANVQWITWNQIFLLVDVVCCCAVFFPIVWSIRSLREASKTDGKAARNLQKLTLFKQFYMVVVCYLYFTRILVSAFGSLLSYQYQWGVVVAEEGASLAFYLFIFNKFQPVERNPYLYIGDEEEEAAAEMLEMEEEFEL